VDRRGCSDARSVAVTYVLLRRLMGTTNGLRASLWMRVMARTQPSSVMHSRREPRYTDMATFLLLGREKTLVILMGQLCETGCPWDVRGSQ
jgi:hypothetical protein